MVQDPRNKTKIVVRVVGAFQVNFSSVNILCLQSGHALRTFKSSSFISQVLLLRILHYDQGIE